ncbi:MAG: transposase [Patescibacteria group bacterium]
MKRDEIGLGEYYHVFNRGNNKQDILFDQRDWIRFLFLILYFQSASPIYNIGRQVSYFGKHKVFNIAMPQNYITELVAFTIMPNHFHFILHEIKENGISKYMQKIQDGYTKYINTKYNRSGHLFQGSYKLVHIKSDEQLLYLSAYIHRNPRELKNGKIKEISSHGQAIRIFFKKTGGEI